MYREGLWEKLLEVRDVYETFKTLAHISFVSQKEKGENKVVAIFIVIIAETIQK